MRGVRFAAVLFLVLSAAGATAQDREIVGPKEPSDPTGFVKLKIKLVKGDDVQWEVSPKPTAKEQYTLTEGGADYSILIFNGPTDTKYTAVADWINWDLKKRGRPSLDVVIGRAPQPPPVPPGPDPKPPVPPGPVPPIPPSPVSDNPFGAAPGVKVMIVTESSDNSKLPLGQFLVLQGTTFRKYVDQVAGEGNYFFLDQNVTFSAEEKMVPFKKAMGRTDRKDAAGNTKLPWLYVGKENAGLSIPLPADTDATKAAIDKFLGK